MLESLDDFQSTFLRRVTAPAPDEDAGMAVHQGTYFYSLLDGLVSIYEASHKLLGDQAFKAFARDFIRARALTSGDRNAYGADFADFLQAHPQLGDLAWLPDLLRFEWALHAAHHARDAEPCGFEALMAPDVKVALHSSAHILSLGHDVRALHATVVAGSEPAPVRASTCDVLIGRTPEDEVITLCLAPLEVDFLRLVRRHTSLLPALDHLEPGDDDMAVLQNLLAGLVTRGLLITL